MKQTKIDVTMWPVADLEMHPDNPRRINRHSEKFKDLVASIQANGIIEPLTVRSDPNRDLLPNKRQILSGHRRFAAARELGLETVPVRDLGDVADDLAYDIVAMANLHEDLTPLEEGKRAAVWLDKYNQDVAAVAAKLGKTPSWVVQHAQIARGLSAEWQAAATEIGQLDRWTAGHWAVIARLPAALQASELAKTRSKAYVIGALTVKELEERIKIEVLYLVKAPFDTAVCEGCIDRTDKQPLLWGEVAESATGDKARCLDRKCWQKKVAAYARKELREIAQDKGVPDAAPLSLLECPEEYFARQKYAERIRELKKLYGSKLLTADQVEVVPEGTQGAIAAIVVAGLRGKGAMAVRWVTEKKEPAGSRQSGSGRGGNFETPRMKTERIERERRELALKAARERFIAIESVPKGGLATLVAMDLMGKMSDPKKIMAAYRRGDGVLTQHLTDLLWKRVRDQINRWSQYHTSYAWDVVLAFGEILGVDVQKIYDEIVAAEEPAAVNEVSEVNEVKKSRKKAKAKAKAGPESQEWESEPY